MFSYWKPSFHNPFIFSVCPSNHWFILLFISFNPSFLVSFVVPGIFCSVITLFESLVVVQLRLSCFILFFPFIQTFFPLFSFPSVVSFIFFFFAFIYSFSFTFFDVVSFSFSFLFRFFHFLLHFWLLFFQSLLCFYLFPLFYLFFEFSNYSFSLYILPLITFSFSLIPNFLYCFSFLQWYVSFLNEYDFLFSFLISLFLFRLIFLHFSINFFFS